MGSLKRLAAFDLGDEEGDNEECPFRESKRRRSCLNTAREVIKLKSMQCLFLELEPFLRRVVREEVQKAICSYVYLASRKTSSPCCPNQSPKKPLDNIQAPISTLWRLSFKSKLPDTLFTGSRIEAEDGTPVKLVIEDSSSGMIVDSGLLSSIRVAIVVIDGDFCPDERDVWTEKEFNGCVVREREGKRPLLSGDVVVNLRDGAGALGAIAFTDNSSWIRSRRFRLGARITSSNCVEERILEAMSGAFFVKDHRGELYKKHHPPSLHDDVWRLEKIGKDGAFHRRLSAKGIRTVQEFMKFLVMDHDQLRSILGSGMSNKIWEATVEHAWECRLDNKLYSYYAAESRAMLVFDSIFQVVGVQFYGYDYQPLGNLTASQLARVEVLKEAAYRNRNGIIDIDGLPAGIISKRLIPTEAAVTGQKGQNLQFLDYYPDNTLRGGQAPHISLQGHEAFHVDVLKSAPSPSHVHSISPLCHGENLRSVPDGFADQKRVPLYSLPLLSSSSTSGFSGSHGVGYASMDASTSGRVASDDMFLIDGNCSGNVGTGNYYAQALTQNLGNRPFMATGGEIRRAYSYPATSFSAHIAQSKWVKLMAALKCGMCIRRRVAAKRKAKHFVHPPALPYLHGTELADHRGESLWIPFDL